MQDCTVFMDTISLYRLLTRWEKSTCKRTPAAQGPTTLKPGPALGDPGLTGLGCRLGSTILQSSPGDSATQPALEVTVFPFSSKTLRQTPWLGSPADWDVSLGFATCKGVLLTSLTLSVTNCRGGMLRPAQGAV